MFVDQINDHFKDYLKPYQQICFLKKYPIPDKSCPIYVFAIDLLETCYFDNLVYDQIITDIKEILDYYYDGERCEFHLLFTNKESIYETIGAWYNDDTYEVFLNSIRINPRFNYDKILFEDIPVLFKPVPFDLITPVYPTVSLGSIKQDTIFPQGISLIEAMNKVFKINTDVI